MNIQILLGAISTIIGICSYMPYIRDVLRGDTAPHRYSWLVWTLLQGTGAIAMWSAGAGWGTAPLAMSAIICGCIFVLSLWHGTEYITMLDKVCLAGALLAIVAYPFLQNATLAVIVVSLTDLVGFTPTILKAYRDPRSETAATYLLSALSYTLAVGALASITFTTSAYLVSSIITNAICGIIIVRGRRRVTMP